MYILNALLFVPIACSRLDPNSNPTPVNFYPDGIPAPNNPDPNFIQTFNPNVNTNMQPNQNTVHFLETFLTLLEANLYAVPLFEVMHKSTKEISDSIVAWFHQDDPRTDPGTFVSGDTVILSNKANGTMTSAIVKFTINGDIVKPGYIALSKEIQNNLKVSQGDVVKLQPKSEIPKCTSLEIKSHCSFSESNNPAKVENFYNKMYDSFMAGSRMLGSHYRPICKNDTFLINNMGYSVSGLTSTESQNVQCCHLWDLYKDKGIQLHIIPGTSYSRSPCIHSLNEFEIPEGQHEFMDCDTCNQRQKGGSLMWGCLECKFNQCAACKKKEKNDDECKYLFDGPSYVQNETTPPPPCNPNLFNTGNIDHAPFRDAFEFDNEDWQ